MADNSLPSTLATQSTIMSDPTGANSIAPSDIAVVNPNIDVSAAPMTDNALAALAKRRPGRPKGSGKKALDPNAPPREKRPVGRPRKDGMPAGSVPGARRASGRPRKIPPGDFASGPSSSTSPQASASAPPFPGGFYNQFHPQWRVSTGPKVSASSPPMASLSDSRRTDKQTGAPRPDSNIDPNLEPDDWVNLAQTKPDAFLHALIGSLAAPNPVSRSGPAVEEAFKSHLVSLQQNKGPTIPSLYSILKTFWLPSSPAYFALTASASTGRTPSEHRFLYWDPQPLVFNGIACPHCSAPLTNRGRIRTGPLKVYDLGKPFFIIGCEYGCKSGACVANTSAEGRKFASTDSSILRSLPAILSEEFPAHLWQGASDLGSGANVWSWQAMGVSKALWNMVRGCLNAGMRKYDILNVIRCIQYGAPDPPEGKQEEEEGDEQEVARHVEDGQGNVEVEAEAGDQNGDNSIEAYNNAWNDISGVANPPTATSGQQQMPSSSTANSGPDTPTASTPNQTGAGAAPQQYPFQQAGGPYLGYPYGAFPYYQMQNGLIGAPNPVAPVQAQGEPSTLKRPFSAGDGQGGDGEGASKRVRHCCKCGSPQCKGKGGRTFCANACQDCGKLECKGRNSKRPDKTCAEAWP